MDDSLFNKVKKDLEKSGFNSELKVGRLFENNNFHTLSGSSYFDKDEQKNREIDILAAKSLNVINKVDEKWLMFSSIVINAEVKKTEKPWVVFKNTYTEDNFFSYINFKTLKVFNLGDLEDHDLYNGILELEKNYSDIILASGIHESFKSPNNPSKWYGACLTAIKSSIESYDNDYDDSLDDVYRYFHLYYPLVILDGELISAELDNDDEIELKKIDKALINISYGTKNYPSKTYTVTIVTINGLNNYLRELTNKYEAITKLICEKTDISKNNYSFKYDF